MGTVSQQIFLGGGGISFLGGYLMFASSADYGQFLVGKYVDLISS